MITRSVTLFLVMLMTSPALWAGVRASLDRNTVYDGDTVTLTIEASGSDMGVEPDLSALKKDFAILGTSSSRRLQFINGKRSDRHQWQIELDPLHKGTLTVPAIPVGRSMTPPLTLKVTEQPVISGTGNARPVFIKTEVDDASAAPFVQQQIHLVVRMYYRVPLLEGSFSDLELDDALVERLGEDRQYQTTIDGERYRVLERHYAIFAEKSGRLTIPATSFTGRVMSNSGRRSGKRQSDSLIDRFFGSNSPFSDPFLAGTPFGNAGQRIRVRGQPLTLDIRPRPAAYRAPHWLPGSELVLQDSWEEGPPEFRVGEPVTRTLTLQAKGLESSHLPDIDIPETANMRLYPEQAVTENRTDGEWVFGIRKQSIAYVPSRPGRVSLPEIRIDWWDLKQQQQRSTVLPGWEVNVLPAPGNTAPRAAPVQQPESGNGASAAGTSVPWLRRITGSHIFWLTSAFFVLLAMVFFLYRKRLSSHHDRPEATTASMQAHATPAAGAARRAAPDPSASAAPGTGAWLRILPHRVRGYRRVAPPPLRPARPAQP
ncbi:MAG: BatD family protein, partial [Thiogranum sp.]